MAEERYLYEELLERESILQQPLLISVVRTIDEEERDLLAACALCHDVGKPYEFDPNRQERWRNNPAVSGWPAIRHPQYGTHVCLLLGLPEEVCHAAGCHSGEGDLVSRSLHVTIVHHADHVFWRSLSVAGFLGLD